MARSSRAALAVAALLLCAAGARAAAPAGGAKPKRVPISDLGEETAAASSPQRLEGPHPAPEAGGRPLVPAPSHARRPPPAEARQVRAILERHPKIMDIFREVIDDIKWKAKKEKKKGGRGLLQSVGAEPSGGTDMTWNSALCVSYGEPPSRRPGNRPRPRRALSATLGPPLSPLPPLSHRRPSPPSALVLRDLALRNHDVSAARALVNARMQ
jgi:hypothetical protein